MKRQRTNKPLWTRILSVAVLLAWMMVISGFSGQNATESAGLSAKVSHVIAEGYNGLLGFQMSEEEIAEMAESIEHAVRKLAHATEYAILAVLFSVVLWTFGFGRRRLLAAVPFCFVYAAMDEYHQTFVEGRAGQLTDVLIDTSGACIAMLCLWLFIAIIGRDRSNNAM